MTIAPFFLSLRRARRFAADTSGLALLEFALALPLVLMVGGYGIEVSNLALANLRVSQYALELADNASRVGVDSGLSTVQLREVDINDVLQGARLEGAPLGLTSHGRVILSSLEGQADGTQLLHWQRCIGAMSGADYDSHYGTAGSGSGGTVVTGMGSPGDQVTAPVGSGVMFVEVNYQYQPLFGSMFMDKRVIHYTASFIVRDKRDFSQVYNPSPAVTPSSCSTYST